MPRIPSQVRRFISSIPVIALLTPLSPALAQQKPAPPSPNSQAQLQEQMKELQKRLNDAEQKAASAAMEKDYITRIQKQYESYYEKAFNTQVTIVSVLTIFITIVLAFAARFGFQTFDRRIDTALRETSAQLRTEFNQQLRTELETLRKENAEQVKQLAHDLTNRVAKLESDLAKRIGQQQIDLKTESEYNVQFLQGYAAFVAKSYKVARTTFREALDIYKDGKTRGVIGISTGAKCTANVFRCIFKDSPEKFEEEAKKELADHHQLYDGLKEELAAAALDVQQLAPIIQQ